MSPMPRSAEDQGRNMKAAGQQKKMTRILREQRQFWSNPITLKWSVWRCRATNGCNDNQHVSHVWLKRCNTISIRQNKRFRPRGVRSQKDLLASSILVIRSRSANTNTILSSNTNTNAVTNKHRSDTFGCLVHVGGQSEKNPKLVDVKINAQKCKYLNRNTETQIQNIWIQILKHNYKM